MNMKTMLRLAAMVLALVCAASPLQATDRPITVDDIVKLEAFGRATIAPDGRWAVYEKRDDYDTIPNYDHMQRAHWTIMDLWRVDLKAAAPRPERLLPEEPVGLLRGEWSPDGRRLIVYRFRGDLHEIGIADVAARTVRWTGLVPELPVKGAMLAWIAPDRFAAVVRPSGDLSAFLRFFNSSQRLTTEAWARTSEGRVPSRTVVDAEGGVVRPETPTPVQTLVVVNAETGAVERDLMSGLMTDVALSPDASTLAVLAGGEPLPLGNPIVQFDEPFRQRLTLIRLADGRRTQPERTLDVAPQLLRWRSDSGGVLVWGRQDDQRWTEGMLTSVESDGRTRDWPSPVQPGDDMEILRGVRADWLNGTPILYGRLSGAERADWHGLGVSPPGNLTAALTAPPAILASAEATSLSFYADGGLWRLDGAGLHRAIDGEAGLRWARAPDPERPRRIGQEADRSGQTFALDTEGTAFVVSADGGREQIGPSGRGEDTRLLGVSAEAVLALEREELVETLMLRRGDENIAIDAVNADRADVVLTRPVIINHKDALGQDAQSTLFLPSGPIRGLIVSAYPGAVDYGGWFGPLVLTYNIRPVVLAGLGYAVLTPAMPFDQPGSRTPAFFEDSIDLAVDAALATHPELPPRRIAYYGHSMGGYIGLIVAARSDRYQSYILSSAASDVFGNWGEFVPATRIMPDDGRMMRNQQGWVETGQGEVGATPWGDPARLAEESPWLKADQVSKPVLLIAADRDFVSMTQAERTFSALARLGKKARLATYWGEYHVRWSPANIRDQYDLIVKWLEETLPPEPQAGTAAGDGKGVAPTP